MIPIFICDDDGTHLSKLKDIVNNCISENQLNYEIVLTTQKVGELISYLEDNANKYGVFILDVDLKNVISDGIGLGKIIRKANQENTIIYVTAHKDAAFLTFKNQLGCLDFILKEDWSLIKNRICDCLVKLSNNKNAEKEKYITYRGQAINLNNLFFIEHSHNQHRVYFHFKDSFYETWGVLKDISELLDNHFVFCDRSLILNISKIKYLDEKTKKILFYNEKSCFTSVSGIRLLKRKLQTL